MSFRVIPLYEFSGDPTFCLKVVDRSLWVLKGDRCLMLRFRRSGFVGGERAIVV
jgi:hypothetical protein